LRQGDDQTVERGDIVVTEERAKQLSQPRFDAQGKPVNPGANPSRQAPKGTDAVNSTPLPPASADQGAAPAAEEKAEQPLGKRKVRAVGPNVYPVR
jgi:hypothetical protein